jgi:hypothetical protein
VGRKLMLLGGLLAVVAAFIWVPAAVGAGAHARVTTCSTFRSSALKPHEPWRGYESGASCGAATAVLKAVAAGRGQVHQGSDSEDSYIIYHGWKCGLEMMGYQLCWRPTSSSFNHASAGIAAIDCSNVGSCPARFPSEDPL